MRIKSDKSGFKALIAIMHPNILENVALITFKKGDISNATMIFLIMEVSVKMAKALIFNRKQISLSLSESCAVIDWFAHSETKKPDPYTLNLIRIIKADLHKQLTNYQLKYN